MELLNQMDGFDQTVNVKVGARGGGGGPGRGGGMIQWPQPDSQCQGGGVS
jgi:hypothetical protein